MILKLIQEALIPIAKDLLLWQKMSIFNIETRGNIVIQKTSPLK